MSRIVVKVGSNVLTRPDGTLDITIMSSLVDQIAELRGLGHEVILVSSGAVACGRKILKDADVRDEVEKRQLYSAMGQVRLIELYFHLFREHGITMGQILTMKEHFQEGRELENQRNCMEVMLRNGVTPVVNENDTVCITELMFSDNDELSALIAEAMDAESLILLTNVNGIYDGNPNAEGAKVIPLIRPDDHIEDKIVPSKSSFGRGGMKSKYENARKLAAKGIKVIIACGRKEHILVDVITKPEQVTHTEFSIK